MLKDRIFMIKVLGILSILMFASICTCMPKIIGIFLSLWVISVFWNLKLMLDSAGLGVIDFVNHIDKRIDEAKTKKKYFQKGLYYVTIPMMVIGMIMVALIIIAFFTIL